MRKYGIEKCQVKHLPLGVYRPRMNLWSLHIQSIRRNRVCVPISVILPNSAVKPPLPNGLDQEIIKIILKKRRSVAFPSAKKQTKSDQ